MLVEFFIFFEIVALILFFTAFFTKQEIIWAISAVIFGVLMFSAWNVQTYIYEYNATILAYSPVLKTDYYPWLMAINMLFFALGILLGLFDLFDKYGINLFKKKSKQ
jgi:hypothetical protein